MLGDDGAVNLPALGAPTSTEPVQSVAIAADGTELVGYRYSGTGVPVLLVHGFASAGGSNWVRTGWVRDLTAAGRDVITVDLRGHGLSGHPTEPGAYRLRTLVSDLSAVLAVVAPEHRLFDAVGYSLGARVVVEFAHVTGRIRRMVLGGSDGRPLYQDVDIPDVVAALRAGAPAQTDHASRIVGIARALPGTNLDAMAAISIGLAAEDVQAGSHTPVPEVPVLVAGGELDEMFTDGRGWVDRINAEFPGRAEYLEAEGRNHITAVTSSVLRAGAVEFLGRE